MDRSHRRRRLGGPAELGSEGWDLGQWPYVVVAATRTADKTGNPSGVATYCEGDVSCTYFRTQRTQWEALTEHAFFSWSSGGPCSGGARD